MKKILALFLFVASFVTIQSQTPYDTVNVRDPQNFVEMTTVDTAYFQLIGRKANLNRRMSLTTLKNWILAGVDGIDTVYWSGDTLNILQGLTLWQAVADDNSGLFDATNDGDTTAIGSVVLGEDLTVELNNHDWLFDGLVEDDTTSRIMTLRGDGSLAYRWLDSLLNGYTTGSGTPGTLPIWTGANAMGNSSLTEASGVLSSSLTGALKLPAGTDAQDPVWAAGMLRYNTTVNGIQGYDGTAERYLPWADADNWANQRIPFSNGSQLTTSADFYYNDATNRLFLNAPTASTGQYAINILNAGSGSGINIGNTNTAIRINASFPAISIGTGNIQFDNNASNGIVANTSNNTYWMDVNTTGANGVPARFRGNRPVSFKNQAGSGVSACIQTNHTKSLDAEYENIRISADENWNSQPAYGNSGTTIGAGLGIDWWYHRRQNGSGYRYKAARIIPVIQDADSLAMDIGLRTDLHINGSLVNVSLLDSAGMRLYLYGAGNLTGTPTQNAAFNSAGRIIERAFAYAEMYIDDTDPDTIAITSGTPAEGTDWLQGELSDFTYSAGRLTYTGTETAKFHIVWNSSASHTVNATNIEGWLYKNNAEVSKSHSIGTVITAGNIVNIGHSAIVELATNNYIELFYDSSNNGDVIVYTSLISLEKI